MRNHYRSMKVVAPFADGDSISPASTTTPEPVGRLAILTSQFGNSGVVGGGVKVSTGLVEAIGDLRQLTTAFAPVLSPVRQEQHKLTNAKSNLRVMPGAIVARNYAGSGYAVAA